MNLPEVVAAGIYDSKIAVKNASVSKQRKASMFEIELPIEEGGIAYLENSSSRIVPGTVICAKPNQTRHTSFPFKCYYVHLIIHDGPLYDILINTPEFVKTNQYDAYKNIFVRIINHFNLLSEAEEIMIQSLLLELIYRIGKEGAHQDSSFRNTNTHLVIENSIKFIKKHLTEKLTLNRIASEMALSPTYFHNIFKTSVGSTLHDYIEEQRIRKAINLIQTTNYSLTRIAYECGFSSQSYFSFAFKRRMKKSVRAYKQEIYTRYEI